MKNKETFPVVLAIIGLTADIISIGALLINGLSGFSTKDLFSNNLFVLLLFFIVVYSWFTISWFIIRKSFLASKDREVLQRRLPVVRNSVLSIGILTLPITIMISKITGDYSWTIIHLVLTPIIYTCSIILIPLTYEEMRIYITRIGDYICKDDIYVNNGEILIRAGERISVIKNRGFSETEKYSFQKGNIGGYLIYSDLINNFKVSPTAKKKIE